jgi:ABC-type Fe3+/spermidine/putrescine transport system ATPase subunit
MGQIEFEVISMHYRRVRAREPFDLQIGDDEFLTCLGPSGRGKRALTA